MTAILLTFQASEFTLNATNFYYPDIFEGAVVRPSSIKTLYLISNNTAMMFNSWGAFVGLMMTSLRSPTLIFGVGGLSRDQVLIAWRDSSCGKRAL